MHKHFRMIAISEHLRNHGFDPDYFTHTRIPGIWDKLRSYYNMEAIDERENTIDYIDDENFDRRFLDFDLPWVEYGEEILKRAMEGDSEAPTSPGHLDADEDHQGGTSKKRKRAPAATAAATPTAAVSANKATRSSTVEDTEAETPGQSPTPKTARGTRSAKRAASKARIAKEEETEAEAEAEASEDKEDEAEEDEEDEESGDADEEGEEEETEAPAAKATRAGQRNRGKSRPRPRTRGRTRA
jgi:DASH complex subunit ASK1